MLDDLSTVLFSESEIQACIERLGKTITEDYQSQGINEITIICITNGSILFTADLMRKLNLYTRLDCIRISSYQLDTKPVSRPEILDSYHMDLKGKHLLLVDDILDTGNTLKKITELIAQDKPASLKTCVLLDKKERRTMDIEADYVGLQIPDAFVVGYGLDFAELYRNLPCIGVLKPELQQVAGSV